MNPFNVKFATSCCVLGLALMWGSAASAQDGGMYKRGDFVVAVSASEVLTSEQLDEVSVGGGDLPGAGVTINNDETVTFDLSYFNGNISGNLGPARVKAKVGVDPIVVNIGLAYRF